MARPKKSVQTMIEDDEPVVMGEGGKQTKVESKPKTLRGPRKKKVAEPQYKAPPVNKYGERALEEMKKDQQMAKAKRTIKGSVQVHHDLFKLLPANFQKNVHLPHQPRWVPVEHCHFFHTRDSKGKKLKYCSSVGGHAHEVEYWVDENGELKAKCGPPIINVKGDRKVAFPNDDHTHEVEYFHSEEVTARQVNHKARMAISDPNFAAKVNSVLVNPDYSLGGDIDAD